MKSAERFYGPYNEREHALALNNQNVYVSHTGDYKENPLYHVHNSCEILLFEEGSAEYRIGNVFYHAGKGDVLIIGGTDPHFRSFKEIPCIRYGLTVLPEFIQTFPVLNEYMNVYRTQNQENASKLRNIDEAVFKRMIQILLYLREETKDHGEGKGDMVYALLLEFTIILKRLLNLEKQDISGTYKVMSEVKSYIDFHYTEDLNLSVLSSKFYLQPNTISKNFGKIFGKNINHYINSVRIANAVRILEDSKVSITELSGMVGYSSVNTFLRQFREKMGISPLQYKKGIRQYMETADAKSLF